MVSITASAFVTGGVGPWLSYQILAAGWIAYGVRLVPGNLKDRFEILALAGYAVIASFLFGILMDLQLWPWLAGIDSQLSFQEGASIASNTSRFLLFHFATSMAWDIPRALLTATLILLTGRAVLVALRRTMIRLNVRGIQQVVPA
jgi:energy-coupling factor transport system substrate-specific component